MYAGKRYVGHRVCRGRRRLRSQLMPLYTYKCELCDYEKELFQHGTEEQEVLCEGCQCACHIIIGQTQMRVWRGAETSFKEELVPHMKEKMTKIMKGKDKDIIDLLGDKAK